MIKEVFWRCISEIISRLIFHTLNNFQRTFWTCTSEYTNYHTKMNAWTIFLFKMRWISKKCILVVIQMRPKMHLQMHEGKFWIFKGVICLCKSLMSNPLTYFRYLQMREEQFWIFKGIICLYKGLISNP